MFKNIVSTIKNVIPTVVEGSHKINELDPSTRLYSLGMTIMALSLFFVTPALAADTGFVKGFESNSSTFLSKIFGFEASQKPQDVFPGPLGIVAYAISMILAFVGLIFLILTIYGGIQWMTAQGNEEQVTKAQKIIKDSIIGLAVVLFAYLITYTIISRFLGVASGD